MFCLQFLEGRNLNKLCQSVKLFVSIFVFITLLRKSYTGPGGWVLDTGGPDVLVQSSVNRNILGSHGLLSKLENFLDRPWSKALEL
jgi:hypothetical protein